MLEVAATAFVLGLFPTFVAAQSKATCLPGYQWSYNSDNVSPCDIAASLAGVCVGGTFTLAPLDQGYVYLGPSATNANSCRCSSVYYSLLSACANCQSRNYIRWSAYNANCTTVYSQVFTQPIPIGLKVPAYAYLNVEPSDNFNASLAQSTTGIESTRAPTSSTAATRTPTAANSSSKSKTNVGAIAGGVVGGVVGLILIGALIFWLVTRKRKPASSKTSSAYEPVQPSPGMGYAPNANTLSSFTMSPAPTTMSHAPTTASPAPGTVYNPNDPTTFPVAAHSTGTGSYHPYPQSGTPDPLLQPNYAQGGIQQNYTGSTHAGRPHYTGAPEV